MVLPGFLPAAEFHQRHGPQVVAGDVLGVELKSGFRRIQRVGPAAAVIEDIRQLPVERDRFRIEPDCFAAGSFGLVQTIPVFQHAG